MSAPEDLLLELGCEELPAREQMPLQDAATGIIGQLLDAAGLQFGSIHGYVTPRRLALWIKDVSRQSLPQETLRRGPLVARARDAQGKPTAAAEGFARSCGVSLDDLLTLETEKGPVLAWREVGTAQDSHALLPEIASRLVTSLPLRKRMRWGAGSDSFLRPVRWLLLRQGGQVLDWKMFGLDAGGESFGHRVHHPQAVRISTPAGYAGSLLQAKVMVDFAERRAHISGKMAALADEMAVTPILPEALLDEITGLNEWPVVLAGSFAADYLRVPEEALITVMMQHQRYVPLRGRNERLVPHYLFAANLHSRDTQVVIDGNNRVLRARLADAAFFWDQDRQISLQTRRAALAGVLFQDGLGSILDKTVRLQELAAALSPQFAVDAGDMNRAAALCKSDLLSGLVGEFPELQGIMGGHYARHDGENNRVATAIAQHYLPSGRDDEIPADAHGQCLAIADKLDTLCGFFAIGKVPTGDRDPFALRRAALGVLRIVLDAGVPLNLDEAVTRTLAAYGGAFARNRTEIRSAILDFFQDRMRVYFREEGFRADQIAAVLSRQPHEPLDARQRLEALALFQAEHAAADALAALIKRINNLLRKEVISGDRPIDPQYFMDPVENTLWDYWRALEQPLHAQLAERRYAAALGLLAGLRPAVDQFFDGVMVLAEDPVLRQNRLALLARLQEAFLRIADFSQLQGA